MLKSATPSIRSPGALRAPAIALLETAIAGAIIAAAALGFLAVLRQARADLALTRERASATMLAMDVLHQAPSTWRSGPFSGERAGLSWRLSCAPAPRRQSARLILVSCRARIARRDRLIADLERSWAEPMRNAFEP